MMFSTPTARACRFVAAALLLTACSSPEEQKRRHFEQGNAYVAEKRDDFAVIEYANAVRIDPKFGEARLKLAETYERMNNIRAAFPERSEERRVGKECGSRRRRRRWTGAARARWRTDRQRA